MAISLASLKRVDDPLLKPERALIYGTHGIGKTTIAAGAPDPILMQTEDGLGDITGVTPTGLLRDYAAVMSVVEQLYSDPHDFRTAAVDSLDWLEPLIWAETCRRNGWPTIDSNEKNSPTAFGKGYLGADEVWREFLSGMNALRDERGMTILFLAHCEIKEFKSPETESFDRYQPKLHKRASALVQENVDSVLFNSYLTSTTKTDPKDKAEKARGIGAGKRVLYTAERPSYLAKNRSKMPAQIMLPDDPAAAWGTLAAHMPYYAAA